MAVQSPLLSINADPTLKEGEVDITTQNGIEYKQGYAILCEPSYLYLYTNKSDRNLIHKVDLRSEKYDCVRDEGKESKQFYLVNIIGQKPYLFEASSIEDKEDWIAQIDKLNVVKVTNTKTVRTIHRVEFKFCLIFSTLVISMLVIFAIGAFVEQNFNYTTDVWFYGFVITLAMYEVVLIVLCSFYIHSFGKHRWRSIKKVIKINKFWIQSVLCVIYNFNNLISSISLSDKGLFT